MSVAVKLRVAQTQLEARPEVAAKLVDESLHELGVGLEELREIARGLHPAILTEQGLRRALDALADRLPVDRRDRGAGRAAAGADRGDRVLHRVRGADERGQALGRRARARWRCAVDGDVLRCEVSDDGRGGADPVGRRRASSGCAIAPRRPAGRCRVVSPPGGGTVVTASLPLNTMA